MPWFILKKYIWLIYPKMGIKVDEFITYGSPRVGCPLFSAWLKGFHPG
jgi:hypothetical protein